VTIDAAVYPAAAESSDEFLLRAVDVVFSWPLMPLFTRLRLKELPPERR
jgi:hypothetical protein